MVSSQSTAAAGGVLYLQFPISVTTTPTSSSTQYLSVAFADPREVDLLDPSVLPSLSLAIPQEYGPVGSMDIVTFAPPLTAAADTTTSLVGTTFPDVEQVLVQSLPDLVFDAGAGRPSRRPGWGIWQRVLGHPILLLHRDAQR